MAECAECGKQTSMPFTCKFCEQSFCSTHRLPENHDCSGLEAYKEQSREEGKVGYDVMNEERDSREPEITSRSSDGWMPDTAAVLPDISIPTNTTYIVLGAMFAAFLMEGFVPGFFEQFALVPEQVLEQPWRLVTSMFLHAGIAHLLINSIVLFQFGSELERILGSERFLLILFGAGLASSIGFTISGLLFDMGAAVGISGGLYGLVAMLAIIRPQIRVLAFFFIPLKIRTAVMFFGTLDFINFIAHTMNIYLPIIGNFASIGHLSGLAVGVALGYLWKDQYQHTRPGMLDFNARFNRL